MTEIKSHTALRGIAALLVVIYHYRDRAGLDLDQFTSFFAKGYLWVDCFFMLSGFILSYIYGAVPANSKQSATRFFRARFARIYPLHIASLLGLAFFEVILPHVSHQSTSPNWQTFWLNVFNVQAWGMLNSYDWNFPSWSISVEFAAYLIYPIAITGLTKIPRLTPIFFLIFFVVSLSTGRENWERLALLHGIPMFTMGMLIYRIPKVPSAILPLQLISLVLLVFALHVGFSDWLTEICFIGLIYSTQWDSQIARHLANPGLLRLGAWSYSIYMLHIPLVILGDCTIRFRFSSSAYFVTMLLVTIVLGAASYRFFEIPLRNLIAGRRHDKPIQEIAGSHSPAPTKA